MYKTPHYTETDRRKLLNFIEEYPLGIILIPVSDDYPEATHLPFMIQERDGQVILRAHLMKDTGHHQALLQTQKVRIVFQGPQAYISASWYNQPAQASTWNYMAVHALGTAHLLDEQATYESIRDLTNRFETQGASGSFSEIPEPYIQAHLKAIVGVEIMVQQIEGVFKLSQNKDPQTRSNIMNALRKRNHLQDQLLADAMEKHV